MHDNMPVTFVVIGLEQALSVNGNQGINVNEVGSKWTRVDSMEEIRLWVIVVYQVRLFPSNPDVLITSQWPSPR